MRAITRCPSCQTQFFVTEVQLNKHNGKVRCGQCLHIFDAKTQFITLETPTSQSAPLSPLTSQAVATHSADEDTTEIVINANQETSDWPAIDNHMFEDEPSPPQKTSIAETSLAQVPSHITAESSTQSLIETSDASNDNQAEILRLNNITQLTSIANSSNYFADLAAGEKRKAAYAQRWRWRIASLLLLIVVIAQCLYFLRDSIALRYPNTKPLLEKMCGQLACSINLPKQIDLIEITDSDMLEDPNVEGLIRLTSTLINHAPFNQAYPNLELTLTDTESNPSLRKIFTPNTYLPRNTNVTLGLAANAEINIKLAISTHNEKVAGYRIFVTYP